MEITADALDVGFLRFSSGAMIGTGGFIDTPNQRLASGTSLPIITPNDLAQVPIVDKKKSDGTPLRLGDVADVVEDHQPLIGDAVINDGPGLLLIVEKFPWANTLQVTRGVEEALAAMRPGLPGIAIDSTIFRPADFIETAIGNLTNALLLGCILVVLVLGAFLFEWRTALISLAAIPLSLMAGALVLYLQGATINTMILAGFVIAVGVVVDDAIIDVENIMRRLRAARQDGQHPIDRVHHSGGVAGGAQRDHLRDADHPAGGGAGLLHRRAVWGLFPPLAWPMGWRCWLDAGGADGDAGAVPAASGNAPLERRSRRWCGGCSGATSGCWRGSSRPPALGVRHRRSLMMVGIAVLPLLGQSLFPQFKERDFLMHWVTKPGTSIAEERRIVRWPVGSCGPFPGSATSASHIGQALLADEVVGVNVGENWISIDPAADYDETRGRYSGRG